VMGTGRRQELEDAVLPTPFEVPLCTT
jgi:hypothetical protein